MTGNRNHHHEGVLQLNQSIKKNQANWRPFALGVSDFMTSEPLVNAADIVAAGMDFIEPGLAKIETMPEDVFQDVSDRIKRQAIQVRSANWFLPPTIKVTGPDVDETKSRNFLENALGRAASLNATTVVFGSPGSRSVPVGFSHHKAMDQMLTFCRLCSEIIREKSFDIRIAVEHVNHTETNLINTFSEAMKLVRTVDRREIGLAADFYHFEMENESTDILADAANLVCAVQLADPAGRRFPQPGQNIARLDRFFEQLINIGYDGGVSIEANPTDQLASDCRGAVEHITTVLNGLP